MKTYECSACGNPVEHGEHCYPKQRFGHDVEVLCIECLESLVRTRCRWRRRLESIQEFDTVAQERSHKG